MYLFMLIILVSIITYYERKLNAQEKQYIKANYKEKYNKKEKLLTQNEILFYKVINEALKDKNIIINSQVVLYEIIETKKNNKNFNSNFNKIKSKSIDFVLTDKEFNILLCIELDDTTHNRKDRIKRDDFINELFEELEIKLLRIPVQNYYSVEMINKMLEDILK